MGVLKHVVLPLLSVASAIATKICLIDEGLVEMAAPALKRDIAKEPPTSMEQHLTRALGGVHLGFLVNNIVAILQENAHYRGMSVLVQAIYHGVDSLSYLKMKRTDGAPVYTLFALSVIGLGIHAMEPGIFTKDKAAMK
jgi:hypothetical protein